MMQSCHSLFLYALPLVLQLVHKNKKGMQVPYNNASNNLAPASKRNWGGNHGNLAMGQPLGTSHTDFPVEILTLVLDLLHQWWVGGAITQARQASEAMTDLKGNYVMRDDPECAWAKGNQLLTWPRGQLRQAWWSRGRRRKGEAIASLTLEATTSSVMIPWSQRRKGEPGQKLISQLALIINNLICFVEFGVFQLAFRFCDIIVYIHYDISSAFVGFSNDV